MSLDVLPADVPAEHAPAMLAACSDALAEGSCAMASSLPESTQPEAVALVLWQSNEFLQVTVRVGRGGGQWLARALTFSEQDSIAERWTTVGLTVATLVGETRPQQLPAERKRERAPEAVSLPIAPPRAPSQPPSLSEPATYSWQGQLGLLTGPGWDEGGWQRGLWLALGFQLPRTPLVLHGFGSYAQSSGPTFVDAELSTRWLSVGVGIGLAGTLQALDVRGSAALELSVRQVNAELAGRNAGDRDVPLRLRALAAFPAQSRVALTGGALLRLPPQSPRSSDQRHLRGPGIAAEILAGVEVRL